MSVFFKQVGVFVFFLVAICILFFGIQNELMKHNADFKFSEPYRNLVMGHSHAECTYNDSLIFDFKNVASSGESYFYTYYKLKKLLEYNDEIETIFIEFTNNQVDQGMDDWIWGEKYISKFYPKYGVFFEPEDIWLLLRKNPAAIINNFSVQQKRSLLKNIKGDYNFVRDIGGYIHYDQNGLEVAISERKNRFKNYTVANTSKWNLTYLKKIVSLCREKNKTVCFVRSPQHELLEIASNEQVYLDIYSKEFKGVSLLDFNNFELSSQAYKNLGHLNYKGAKIVSKTMNTLLKDSVSFKKFLLSGDRWVINDNCSPNVY